MPRQSELFDRAAECERLMGAASDPMKKATLEQLRNLWIALANESPSFTAQVLAGEITAIEKIQSSLAAEMTRQLICSDTEH